MLHSLPSVGESRVADPRPGPTSEGRPRPDPKKSRVSEGQESGSGFSRLPTRGRDFGSAKYKYHSRSSLQCPEIYLSKDPSGNL